MIWLAVGGLIGCVASIVIKINRQHGIVLKGRLQAATNDC